MPHIPDDPRVDTAKRMIKEVFGRLAGRGRFTLEDADDIDAAIDLLAEGIRAETIAAGRYHFAPAEVEAPSSTSAAAVIPIDSARRKAHPR